MGELEQVQKEQKILFIPRRVLRVYEFRTTCWNCKEQTKRTALTEEFVSPFSSKWRIIAYRLVLWGDKLKELAVEKGVEFKMRKNSQTKKMNYVSVCYYCEQTQGDGQLLYEFPKEDSERWLREHCKKEIELPYSKKERRLMKKEQWVTKVKEWGKGEKKNYQCPYCGKILGREPEGRVEKIGKEEHKMKIEGEMWKCKECKMMMKTEEGQEEQEQELVWSETYDVAQRMRNYKYSQVSLEAFIKPERKKGKKKGEKRVRYVIRR